MKTLTKRDLEFIVENWATMKTAKIAEKIGVSEASVTSYATILRKMGVEVPKKNNSHNRLLMTQFAEEWKQTHKKKG